MQKDTFDNWQRITQQSLENMKKWGETNLKVSEKLLQEQVELTNALFEAAAQNAEVATKAKDIKDVAAWQAEWAQNWAQKWVESCRNCADIMTEAGKSYNDLFEAGWSATKAEKGGKSRKAA